MNSNFNMHAGFPASASAHRTAFNMLLFRLYEFTIMWGWCGMFVLCVMPLCERNIPIICEIYSFGLSYC